MVVTVLVPTALSILYFGLIASDVYVSESRFLVRMPQRSQQPSALGALLQGNSVLRSQDDAFSVQAYMQSRDALHDLDKKLDLRKAFGRDGIDILNRFPGPLQEDRFELLYRYYGKRVSVDYDSTTAIATLKVNAFTAEDSFAINESLLQLSEALVNRINVRAREDLVKFAQAEVAEAENKARAASLALAGYRNERAVFDPERQSVAQLQQIAKLQDELIAAKSQLLQVQTLTPQNPQIPVLRQRVQLLQTEIASEMEKIAGSGNSLSNKASRFERLNLERTFADRQLGSALASLESARNEARRQQLYLERIALPSKPDYAVEPRRIRSIISTFVVGLVLWGVLGMLIAGAREHQD